MPCKVVNLCLWGSTMDSSAPSRHVACIDLPVLRRGCGQLFQLLLIRRLHNGVVDIHGSLVWQDATSWMGVVTRKRARVDESKQRKRSVHVSASYSRL